MVMLSCKTSVAKTSPNNYTRGQSFNYSELSFLVFLRSIGSCYGCFAINYICYLNLFYLISSARQRLASLCG